MFVRYWVFVFLFDVRCWMFIFVLPGSYAPAREQEKTGWRPGGMDKLVCPCLTAQAEIGK